MDGSSPGCQVRALQKSSFMKTSWMTLSFSPCSMLHTRFTSTWAVICLISGSWASGTSPVGFSSLVWLLWTWLGWSGKSQLMWPFFWHLKHFSFWCNVALSSSVRAALAWVCPGVRSMAFGFLANPCYHCCFEGHWLFWNLWLVSFFELKWAWKVRYLLCCLIAPSIQSSRVR